MRWMISERYLYLSYSTSPPHPTTSFLTAANWIYALGAGITAGAGTRLVLQLFLVDLFTSISFQSDHFDPPIFIVTASYFVGLAIFAPAAFLGSGSHLSGSLSGIEPQFSVTRNHHGSPLHYHPKLIGQKLDWSVVGARPYDRSIISIHQ